MDLNSAWIFVRVVQAGSFSGAARQLKMPVSTVSTKISQLEQRLRVSLIQRTTRKLSLTEAGKSYFTHALRAVSEIQEAEASTTLALDDAQGLLRITAPVEMGVSALPELLAGFIEKYPKVRLDLSLTDQVLDLVAEGMDLAIRMGELDDSTLISKKIGVVRFQAFATPAYLRKAGRPRQPQELEKHACLRFTAPGDQDVWEMRKGEKAVRVHVEGPCAANNLTFLHQMTLKGRAIGLLPQYMCTEELQSGKLVRVLEDWVSDEVPVNVVYPQQKFLPKRVRVFLDYLSNESKTLF